LICCGATPTYGSPSGSGAADTGFDSLNVPRSKRKKPPPLPTPRTIVPSATRSARLSDVERDHIRTVLESTGWRVRGSAGAADRLGLKPTTLETRMAKLGLKRPSPA